MQQVKSRLDDSLEAEKLKNDFLAGVPGHRRGKACQLFRTVPPRVGNRVEGSPAETTWPARRPDAEDIFHYIYAVLHIRAIGGGTRSFSRSTSPACR